MNIELTEMFTLQKQLDQRIFAMHQTTRQATHRRRLLALLIELGECANETRCFKYWSQKGPSEPQVIQEEYSDVIHFILSLGIDLGCPWTSIVYTPAKADLSEVFLQCFTSVNQLIDVFDEPHYLQALRHILALGAQLGLDGPAIQSIYLAKNRKNHVRQDENY